MSIATYFGRFAAEFAAARNRYLTERQVRALPPEIQKDIGWPDVADRREFRRPGLGTYPHGR
jgi:hypothetical protein